MCGRNISTDDERQCGPHKAYKERRRPTPQPNPHCPQSQPNPWERTIIIASFLGKTLKICFLSFIPMWRAVCLFSTVDDLLSVKWGIRYIHPSNLMSSRPPTLLTPLCNTSRREGIIRQFLSAFVSTQIYGESYMDNKIGKSQTLIHVFGPHVVSLPSPCLPAAPRRLEYRRTTRGVSLVVIL